EEPDGSSTSVAREVRAGTSITLALAASCRLAGSVSDASGHPIDGFAIQLVSLESGKPRYAQFTRAAGRFSLERVPAGKLRVTASDGAGQVARAEVELSAGQNLQGLQLTLQSLSMMAAIPSAPGSSASPIER